MIKDKRRLSKMVALEDEEKSSEFFLFCTKLGREKGARIIVWK